MDGIRRPATRRPGKLKSSILSLRSTCEGLFGKESLRALGLDFKIAQNPQGGLRQGEIIRERLLSSEGELTPERWVKATLAREELVSELDEDIDEVRTTVRRLVEQRKVVDTGAQGPGASGVRSPVNVSQVATINKSRLLEHIGMLPGRLLAEVEDGVRLVLGL